ncbi:MAG: hypothetical protein CMH54_12170, partial [Myxococcales bacterium]|nr:hypothetical protein [Myxococcales bacterium]
MFAWLPRRWNSPFLVVLFLHTLICLWVLQQPGLQGLGYLSSFSIGVVLLFTAPLAGFFVEPRLGLRGLMRAILVTSLLLFGIPFLFALLQSFWVPLCNGKRALAFWLIGPLFGVVFGVSLGISVRRWIRGRSLWWGLGIGLCLLLMSVGYHLYRLYTEPSVFFFHPIAGYFAGPIYDLQVHIGVGYVLHRLWWCGAFFLLFLPWCRRKAIWAGVGVIWLLVGFGLKSHLGIDPGRTAIMNTLTRTHTGTYVTVHADQRGYTKEEVQLLSRVLDFHSYEVSQWLGFTEPPRKVDALIFRDAKQKKRLMGAGRTEIAKPWLHEVYVGGTNADDPVLRHELAHAIAGALVASPLEVPTSMGIWPRMGFIEGLATAATWESGSLTPHGWSAMMEELGIRPSLQSLLSPTGFYGAYGPTAYTVSASFMHWYREEFGVEALRRLYRTGNFGAGQSLKRLEARWVDECLKPESKRLGPNARRLAKERFQRRAAYQRPCAFELEDKVRTALRPARAGDLHQSEPRLDRLISVVGGDPQFRALRLRAARLAGDAVAMIDAARELATVDDVRSRPNLWGRVVQSWSDALWWMDFPNEAAATLEQIDTDLLDRSLARSITVRRVLLQRLNLEDRVL